MRKRGLAAAHSRAYARACPVQQHACPSWANVCTNMRTYRVVCYRSTEFDGYDEDETVKVVLNGNQVPRSVEVTQEAIDAGAEELSRRLTTAMQEAHGKSVAGVMCCVCLSQLVAAMTHMNAQGMRSRSLHAQA